ncbi:MAG: hypothetical protein Q9170_004051 [Blastenia crenularia]
MDSGGSMYPWGSIDSINSSESLKSPQPVFRQCLGTKDHLTGLPNELLGLVMDRLSKADLKSFRVASKILSEVAVPRLFSTAVVSIFPTDLDVFTNISNHPRLSKAVTTLIYNMLHFPGPDAWEYPSKMVEQLEQDLSGLDEQLHPILEVQLFQRLQCGFRDHSPSDTERPCCFDKCRMINDGCYVYQEQHHEQKSPYDIAFLETVLNGVYGLPNLTRVVVKTSWSAPTRIDFGRTLLDGQINDDIYYGSLISGDTHYGSLARNWHPLRLRPSEYTSKKDIICCFFGLFTILEEAKTFVTQMDLGHSFPGHLAIQSNGQHQFSSILPSESFLEPSLRSLDLVIDLTVSTTESYRFDGVFDVIDEEVLERFWRRMGSLRNLKIGFRCPCYGWPKGTDDTSLTAFAFLFEFLFDRSDLPPLTSLCLAGFAGPSDRLLRVLRNYRNLQSLHLCSFYLTEGTWVEVLNGIRGLGLGSFGLNRLPGDSELDRARRSFGDYEVFDLEEPVEQWVVNEGDHPLRQISQDAAGWWSEIPYYSEDELETFDEEGPQGDDYVEV